MKAHTNERVKTRERPMRTLAKQLNSVIVELGVLIKRGDAPPGAILPKGVATKELFALSADDNLWDDAALADPATLGASPPRWMADEAVMKGIRAAHDVVNCERELARCELEVSNMRHWWGQIHSASIKDRRSARYVKFTT